MKDPKVTHPPPPLWHLSWSFFIQTGLLKVTDEISTHACLVVDMHVIVSYDTIRFLVYIYLRHGIAHRVIDSSHGIPFFGV